jgi:hypothetical protein
LLYAYPVGSGRATAPARYGALVLVQPAQSLTDLALGVVVLVLAVRLGRVSAARPAHRFWSASMWWAGIAALCGALHHGVMVRWTEVSRVSWSLISGMVVVAISYLLAATVVEVLGPGRTRTFWLLRSVGLVAYGLLAITGHAGITAILACESLTMLSVLALWALAAHWRHPLAGPVLLAILASGGAGAVQALSPDVTGWVGLDPTSAYHVAQIGGMLLLYRAVRRPHPAEVLPEQAELSET